MDTGRDLYLLVCVDFLHVTRSNKKEAVTVTDTATQCLIHEKY